MNKNKAFSLVEIAVVVIIIMIMLIGIFSALSFFDNYKLSAAQKLTSNSPVDKIEDLSLWLEPTMQNSFTSVTNGKNVEDKDIISSWNDNNSQTIQKNNFSQGTDSKRPSYVRKGIGNLPSLLFSGDNYLETTVFPIVARKNAYTIIVVFQQNDNSGSQTVFYQGGSSCNGSYAGVSLASDYINGFACGSQNSQASTYNTNKPYAVIYRVDASQSDNVTIYVNGEKYGPVAKTIDIEAVSSAIGYSGTSSYFKGMISEVIVYIHPLNDVEITDIRDYLRGKYGFGA
ncbi:MAG: prepilin-type N-terminal cleavage/methylation domain-containing protein [Rickettsiales bacterium]|nr:prepilin-type N-terminal cleavage/methylation domain-containing protein [Rickettsiales bacterium]